MFLYNNANRANCISSSIERKEDSKNADFEWFSFESASQNFLGITDVLYLENYESWEIWCLPV